MVTPKGVQGHLAPLPLFCFPTSGFANRHHPGLTRPVGKKFHMADERPCKGWAGTYLQGSFTEDGDHGSYSWAPFRDSGKGKQESLDHREARSRKKHSAKLGQKPFPSCVKNPKRLGRQPEEVPCPWIQGSGKLGMLRFSSPLHRGLMGSLEGSWQPTQASWDPRPQPGPPTMSERWMGLFCPIHA